MKLGFDIKSHTDSIYKLEKRLDPVNPPYMEYYKSTSNTSPTMGSWSKTIPFWESEHFLWTRWVYTYTNGTLEMSDPVLDKTWSIMTDYEASKSWTKRFDELTNYGKVKGILCDPISGAVYFNADYINTGKLKAQFIDTQGLIIRENDQGYLEPVLVDDDVQGLKLNKVATSGSYNDLSETPNLSSVATSGNYNDLNGKPSLSSVATTGKYSDLNGKPNLSDVATSGNYSDLKGKPNLSNVATTGKYSDLLNTPSLSSVATSGNYSDLKGKPDIDGTIKTALKGYIYADGTVGATPKEGATGFLVSSDGTLQASNAVIYGKVVASAGAIGGIYIYKNSIASQNGKFSVDENGYIQAKSGTIGGIDISDNGLHSWQYLTYNGDYLLDGDGNRIIKKLFSLDNEGNLYALNAHIGGSIDIGTTIGNSTIGDVLHSIDDVYNSQVSNDLLISSWCNSNDKTLIDGAKIYTGTITADKLNVNEMRGTNGVIYLKDGTFDYGNGKLKWDGSSLTINGNGTFSGNISADTGNIAGWVIESNGIYQKNDIGNVSVCTGVGGIDDIGTSSIDFLRVQKSDGTYPFYVHKDGSLYANNVDISGNISASTITGGTISGATISGVTISGATLTGDNTWFGKLDTQAIQTNSSGLLNGADIWTSTIRLNALRSQNNDSGNISMYANEIYLSNGTRLSSGPNDNVRKSGYPVVSTNSHSLGMYWGNDYKLHVIVDTTDFKIRLE